MNRELVQLARGDRSLSLTYLVLLLCAGVMVGNLLREAFHLRAKAPQIAAAFSARADHLAARALLKSPHTNLTVTPAVPAHAGSQS